MFSMQIPVVVLILSALLTCPCVSSEVVGKCSRTKAEWERESDLLHCQEPYHYHCVRDDTGHLMQLCSHKIWIQKEMCPEFNSKVRQMDVFECPSTRSNCPPTTFWSNRVYLYPACYNHITTTTKTMTRVQRNETASNTEDDHKPDVILILSVVLPTLLTCSCAFGALACLFFRRRRGRNENSSMLERHKPSGDQWEQANMLFYIVEGSCSEKTLLTEQTRILLLVLLNPNTTTEMARINEEAKLTFAIRNLKCETLSCFLQHNRKHEASVHLRTFDFSTSCLEAIVRKSRDVVSSAEIRSTFVVTVPLYFWSPDRKTIMSISQAYSIFKITYI